jgi:hypothetical protein
MDEERVERRLAAIMAGDVAGYSRLMSADEEGTLRNLFLRHQLNIALTRAPVCTENTIRIDEVRESPNLSEGHPSGQRP